MDNLTHVETEEKYLFLVTRVTYGGCSMLNKVIYDPHDTHIGLARPGSAPAGTRPPTHICTIDMHPPRSKRELTPPRLTIPTDIATRGRSSGPGLRAGSPGQAKPAVSHFPVCTSIIASWQVHPEGIPRPGVRSVFRVRATQHQGTRHRAGMPHAPFLPLNRSGLAQGARCLQSGLQPATPSCHLSQARWAWHCFCPGLPRIKLVKTQCIVAYPAQMQSCIKNTVGTTLRSLSNISSGVHCFSLHVWCLTRQPQ